MRQTKTTSEKIDPLTRIQEEIKEVVRREQEHRQLTSATTPTDDYDAPNNNITINPIVSTLTIHHDDNLFNTPSFTSSELNKESLEDHHSDDSGISASSSPVNGTSANNNNNKDCLKTGSNNKDQRYIGPNCYNLTPEPPQQKLMTRTVSTPQLAITKPLQFAYSPAHKGVMQRFIAARGKLQLSGPGGNAGASKALMQNKATTPPNTPMTPALGHTLLPDFNAYNPSSMAMMSAVIERDAEGRPIRRGYVPVELKIQRELKDLKCRESELKKIRKIRQSTPDLLGSIENEHVLTDEDDDEVEHCYGPGQLRCAKSISELCDSAQSNHSISPRTTPSPYFDTNLQHSRGSDMRPAMSLALLCDLDPEEAPSSHRLIAQWESLIQQNA